MVRMILASKNGTTMFLTVFFPYHLCLVSLMPITVRFPFFICFPHYAYPNVFSTIDGI